MTFGSFSRNAGGVVLLDSSAGGSLLTAATGVLGYASVTDAVGTGLAYQGGANITRLTSYSGGTLADNSNSASADFTTAGMAANPLLWSNGLTTRSVNSLTFDSSLGSQVVRMGAAGNILTVTSGAIQKVGANDATLAGGQVGAANSEVIVQQNGTGTLFLNSLLSGGTGSFTKMGAGTVQLSGGLNIVAGTLNASTSVTVPDASILSVGQAVAGGGIPAGTTITAISGNTLTLSQAATFSGTSNLVIGAGNAFTGEIGRAHV